MKVKRTRSIKRASFYGMLSGSLVFVIINFFILTAFVITLTYLLVSSEEDNLSKILINNLSEKQQRIVNISDSLAKTMADNSLEKDKSLLLENTMEDIRDIDGVLILDKNGIIIDTSSNYKDFLGIDFSGRDYYKQLIENKEKKTIISNSYVSYRTKKITINIVSPIMRNNQINGMVVALVNPSIIENDNLKSLDYYLVDSNGDLIFQSYDDNIVSKEDNIKDSIIMKSGFEKTNAIFYKDKASNELVLGIIRKEPISGMNIIVQQHILSNTNVFNGLFVVLITSVIFVFLFIFLFSSGVSSVITNYINIFKNQVKRISSGDYDVKFASTYPHEEINEILGNFTSMAQKIKVREEELQAYNEELVAANDEIKTMMSALSKNEKEKKEQYMKIIWTMVNLLEIKDEYTAGHSKAVTYYAEEIAEKLNRDYGFKIDVERIQVAAILHDIGKIGIEREILNKPSRLTKEEYEIIKTHPAKGFYALKDIDSLKEERKIIKYHHERYDGLGYPDGIKGDTIPFGARIICVADSFDAMVSDRPYRKGLPIETAISELIKNKGTQFDPLIVDVFVSMLREGQLDSEQNEAN